MISPLPDVHADIVQDGHHVSVGHRETLSDVLTREQDGLLHRVFHGTSSTC